MTYDLMVWPVDRAMTVEDAIAEIERRSRGFQLGFGHEKRLDPFIAEMEQRYPALRGRGPGNPPCEFDVHRRHVALGLPWSRVEELTAVVAETAWRTGLAVFDPQRRLVGLPSPFADEPLGLEGVDEHVRKAEENLGAIAQGAAPGGDDSDGGGDAGGDAGGEGEAGSGMSEQLRAIGAIQKSPLGFDITPDIEAEYRSDPTRIPTRLQTPDRKASLLAGLASERVGERHQALTALAGWDPDPQVAEALRPFLGSDDVFEATTAADGLARQGDLVDLPGLVELVHRLSPADGGTDRSMLQPLKAALRLAEHAGPEIVDGLRERARQWRGDPRARRRAWEDEASADLDELLREG